MAGACPEAVSPGAVEQAPSSLLSGQPVLHPWFAVCVHARSHELSAQMLAAKGLECFSPCYTEVRNWSDRRKLWKMPLFPGYLFCRFDVGHWLPVVQTPGVVRVVSAGKTLLPVSESEIAAVRRVLKEGRAVQPAPYLNEGERVRIENGPLRGIEGILIRAKNKLKIVLSVTTLARSFTIELDRDRVRPIY